MLMTLLLAVLIGSFSLTRVRHASPACRLAVLHR